MWPLLELRLVKRVFSFIPLYPGEQIHLSHRVNNYVTILYNNLIGLKGSGVINHYFVLQLCSFIRFTRHKYDVLSLSMI